MPSYDVGRYLMTVLAIGIVAGGLMWAYDQLATPYNEMITSGIITHISVQAQTIIYWGVLIYAPINLLFATIAALLVANARSEYNSPMIVTDISGHIIIGVTIILALFANMLMSSFFDPFVTVLLQAGSMIGYYDPGGRVMPVLIQAFNAAHLLCAIAVAIGYLYMIFTCIRVQTLQWSV